MYAPHLDFWKLCYSKCVAERQWFAHCTMSVLSAVSLWVAVQTICGGHRASMSGMIRRLAEH